MGKPLAGQLGQMGSPSQSQMGGGFGGSQPQLRQPALESPYNGSGGGGMQLPGMGTFQDFIRQQQMGQQAPQMPMIGPGGGGNLDFYQQQMPQMPMSQMPQQNLIGMLQGMGNKLGSTGQPLGEEGFGPAGSRPQMPMSQMPPTLGQATQSQMQQQPQQAAQAQQIYALNQQLQGQGRPGMLGFSPEQMQQSLNPVGAQSPQPQMPLRAPQQVRPEPPRMQAMRGIQQLANRQRGYNR